jgi:hypothetical protein
MRKTGLPIFNPLEIDPVGIAYEDSCPVPAQFFEGLFGATGLDTEEGHRGIDHHPQPSQDSMLIPGSLVNEVHFGAPYLDRHGFIIGKDRPGNPIHTALESATAY